MRGMVRVGVVGVATSLMGVVAAAEPPASRDWFTVGGDNANGRYSALSEINVSNIRSLGGAWFKELHKTTRATPVTSEGMLYITDTAGIYALDPKNGNTLWEYEPQQAAPAREGVALGMGLVFCGLSNGHIIALDQKTGKLVWTGYMGNAAEETARSGPRMKFAGDLPEFSPQVGYIANSPTYVNGMVISGLSGGDGGARGKVSGLDALSGQLIWNFFVIPSQGEAGSETWPQDGVALQRGGGGVWTHGAADAELGLVYYGTGNPVPAAGGEARTGDNRYTASIIALDVKTGKLRWSFQLTHHDIWEMDVSTPLVLYTAHVNGRSRKALAAMRPDGYLFLLDRETGKPLDRIEERPVKQDIRLRTATTQPFPVDADEFGPPCTDKETLPPGFAVGCYFDPIYYDKPNVAPPTYNPRFAPMSYDAATGRFYVMGMVTNWLYRRFETPNALLVYHPPDALEYGIYAAIDSHTNKIVWQKRSPWGLAGGSGALTTAGGLLFHTEGDGNVQAHDAKTGQLLWQFQTGFLGDPGPNSNAGGVPSATYELDHKQYLAVPMGKGLWAFTLGGRLPPRPAPAAPPNVFGYSGIVQPLPADGSGEITLATVRTGLQGQGFVGSAVGQEHFVDEYAIAPGRARVTAGTPFKWTNMGVERHSIVAKNGSWNTGEIPPAQSVTMSIAKPGTYAYYCKDHPWSQGQLIVTAPDDSRQPDANPGGMFSAAQAARGRSSYQTNCAIGCHMADLSAAARAPALAGDVFSRRWRGQTVNDLFERIRNTMPQQNPHSLSDQVYLDITAFLLQSNGLPSGSAELNGDPVTLGRIVLNGPAENPSAYQSR
jgi:quinohemoprotein ethanol dehydrogenase